MMSSLRRRHSGRLELGGSVRIASNNPSSWFSSEDKAEALFTRRDGTAVLDMTSCLELWGFSRFLFVSLFCLVNMDCK